MINISSGAWTRYRNDWDRFMNIELPSNNVLLLGGMWIEWGSFRCENNVL